jgi:hypothetical protein
MCIKIQFAPWYNFRLNIGAGRHYVVGGRLRYYAFVYGACSYTFGLNTQTGLAISMSEVHARDDA